MVLEHGKFRPYEQKVAELAYPSIPKIAFFQKTKIEYTHVSEAPFPHTDSTPMLVCLV